MTTRTRISYYSLVRCRYLEGARNYVEEMRFLIFKRAQALAPVGVKATKKNPKAGIPTLEPVALTAKVSPDLIRDLIVGPIKSHVIPHEDSLKKLLDTMGPVTLKFNHTVLIGSHSGVQGYIPKGLYTPGVTQAVKGKNPDNPDLITTEDLDTTGGCRNLRRPLRPDDEAQPGVFQGSVPDLPVEEVVVEPEPEAVTPAPESPKAEVPGLKVEVKVTPMFDAPSEFRRSISERMAKFIALNVFTDEEVQEMLNTVARAALAKMTALTN